MTLSRFHVAPPVWPPSDVSVCGGPPIKSTFFKYPSAANTMYRLSGDPPGHITCDDGFSVPGSIRAVEESSARTQMASRRFGDIAANATRRPLGETAISLEKRICETGISKRTSGGEADEGRL